MTSISTFCYVEQFSSWAWWRPGTGSAINCANDLPGLRIGITTYEDPAEQPRLAGRIVGRLLAERFLAKDIATLSCRGLKYTAFQDAKRVGNASKLHANAIG